jgi:hypothetical protein
MNVSAPNASAVQTTQRPTQAQQAEKKTDVQTRQQAPETEKSPPVAPKPVINTQGQTTGRLLNVTA